MTLYHGSPQGGIGMLQPSLSQHGKAYVYFSTNPVIAAMYVFNPLPAPHAFFPYGFDREGRLIYEEYYEGQFEQLYGGREGFLYECDNVPGAFNPTQIPHVLVSAAPVPVSRCTRIPDAAEYFRARAGEGKLRIPLRRNADAGPPAARRTHDPREHGGRGAVRAPGASSVKVLPGAFPGTV